ncbi:uncharacterized protein NPIL_688731 [Nephila pilipes]|uniref:Uncharacterized protein n=1 Tax=Nephila pilipes TaxID=299642 RepID=A0A8X6MR90_NEPPI|nr:uncharacterized protein NPIL_688731 [Nephila pilipes]
MSCGAELAKRRTEQASISGGIRAAINRRLSRPGVYDSPEASKSSELQLADCQRVRYQDELEEKRPKDEMEHELEKLKLENERNAVYNNEIPEKIKSCETLIIYSDLM